MTDRLWTAARVLFVLGGLAFLVVALVGALRDPDLAVTPSPLGAVVAVLLVVGALWAAAMAWARLLDRRPTQRLVRGFMLAQLGKYVPGGVWQAIGQVRDATDATSVTGVGAATALVSSVLVTATAGATVGSAAALLPDAPVWVRVGTPLVALGSLALLARPAWMGALVRAVGTLRRRVGHDELPRRDQLLVAWLWSLPTLVVAGVVYAIALHGVTGEVDVVAVPAFALAWTIGFLAIPFPAGLGVREAVLLVLLPGRGATELVAAAALVRVLYIVGELVAIATSTASTTREHRR